MQQLKLFNSYTGKKEIFKPIKKNSVGMYVCGPTVYNNVHLGNCRTFISFDLIFRYLKHLGYKVKYVRNITDVGHLENDSDFGEDRILKKAKIDKIEPMEVAQKYTIDFYETLSLFNVLPPSIEPTATGHIIEQIELIKKIIKKGFAYEVNGSVYFDVLKYDNKYKYGTLTNKKIDELFSNSRELSGQGDKKNPQDFALWKKAKKKHIMRWPSPWSDGFPGWHLECSAMSSKYLGNKFDIHGGGIDLKFPHHECEIAQCEAANDIKPVNYWLHANMLTLNNKKMSKSTGNNILPGEIINGKNNFFSKPISAEVIRFFILQAHYRSILDISEKALLASEKGFKKLIDSLSLLQNIKPSDKTIGFDIENWEKLCYDSMNDDFNSPILISNLFSAVKFINSINDGKSSVSINDLKVLSEKMKLFFFEILGLKTTNKSDENINSKTDDLIKLILKYREKSRKERDFKTSDIIRDDLEKLGIIINDTESGTNYNSN